MLLPMTELTDDGGDMKLSNITGELHALQQAIRWFISMPDDKFNGLTSVVILRDCLWALRALINRQKARSHKKFIKSLSSELKTLGERNLQCVILLHLARAHTVGIDRASLGNAAADLLAKEGARLAYVVPRVPPTCPSPRVQQRRRTTLGRRLHRWLLRPSRASAPPTGADVVPGPPGTGPALPVRAVPRARVGVG